MTVSEKIFELLNEREMSQKEFSEKTGISQSSISDWKRKKTNPVSEKIMIICEALSVTSEELLSGTEGTGSRSNPSDRYVIKKDTELGQFITDYQNLSEKDRNRLNGYLKAMQDMRKKSSSNGR
ncbi:MAG: helix-turn-helix transcriptional regulator [Lachnospiraceae bacterium]|jgi:transcriptional regulator with XRE-family HTH domain|nr:helix-turn-helix transcriptional regulator [Lachnospiraceae bacterium]